jgi:hypothetical protein
VLEGRSIKPKIKCSKKLCPKLAAFSRGNAAKAWIAENYNPAIQGFTMPNNKAFSRNKQFESAARIIRRPSVKKGYGSTHLGLGTGLTVENMRSFSTRSTFFFDFWNILLD